MIVSLVHVDIALYILIQVTTRRITFDFGFVVIVVQVAQVC